MSLYVKKLVSKQKRRYTSDGFDLDLTFITDRICAMGFPSQNVEGIYRNHYKDVLRFFDTRHRDHYKVYNLCSEREYDPSKFHGRVVKYPFDDHNPPPFQLIEPFCKDVEDYLNEDPLNVVAIHCKAGKGRTGVMICAYLMHDRSQPDVARSLQYYGHARTKNGKGVTIASQRRYVEYYGEFLKLGKPYLPRTLILKMIKLNGVPTFKDGACVPQFTLRQGPDKVLTFKSGWYEGIGKDQKEVWLKLHKPTPVCGDIKIEFWHKNSVGKDKMFHLWINTFFVEKCRVSAPKSEIDKANKDKKHSLFPADFAVELFFDDPQGNGSAKVVTGDIAPSADTFSPRKPTLSCDDTLLSDSDLTEDEEEDDSTLDGASSLGAAAGPA